MEPLTLKINIAFNAPIKKVWQGLTDPKLVKKYFFNTNLKSDFKKGSRITFTGEWNGVTYEDGGEILEIDEPKLLKYSYWSSMSGTENKPENYNHITYELHEGDGVTSLTITQDGIKTESSKAHSEQNWQSVFNGLKELLEQR